MFSRQGHHSRLHCRTALIALNFSIILSWDLFLVISTHKSWSFFHEKPRPSIFNRLPSFSCRFLPLCEGKVQQKNNHPHILQLFSIRHYFQTSDCFSQDSVWFWIVSFKMWGWELSVPPDVVVHYGIHSRTIIPTVLYYGSSIFLLIETKCTCFPGSCLYTY